MQVKKKIMVGTRASALAVRQTELFLKAWQKQNPDLEFEIKKMMTTGDKINDRFLAQVGGKGLFLKEIEEALLNAEVDLAVHSLKDVPAELPSGLQIACYPVRESPWDVLVSAKGISLAELKLKAVVGTSSLRRRAQLLKIRPDLNIQLLRGNIHTRLQKLEEKKYDAIVLAEAGLHRMDLSDLKYQRLPLVPAPGQGALAIEICASDEALARALQKVHCHTTQQQVEMERWVMRQLGGNCSVPLGVHAQFIGGEWQLEAFLGTPDGKAQLHFQLKSSAADRHQLAGQMLELLQNNGADEILQKSQDWVKTV